MTCKTYIGVPRRESVTGQPVVTVCDGQKCQPLSLRLDLINHSPTGFGWGYGGSGPAQLALALLADSLGDNDRAIRLHQDFKKVVAYWPEGERWWITAEQIAAVVKVIEQEAAPTANEKDGAAGAAPSRASLSTGGPDAA